MRVILFSKKALDVFKRNHKQCHGKISDWIYKTENANWETPNDIKNTFSNADILGKGSNRVVFNLGGNKYRIIGRYSFRRNDTRMYIKWIGTHAEYTRLCKTGKQYTVDV